MNKTRYVLAGLLLAFFAFFLLLPLAVVVAEGASFSVLKEIFLHPLYREGMLNSLLLAAAATGIVFVIALPLALVYDRYSFRFKELLHLLLLCPLILPPFVGAIGFQQVFGRYGLLNTVLAALGASPVDFFADGGFWLVALCEALHLYPILYLNLLSSLANLDPALDEAARNLGAGRLRRFFAITFPLVKSGALAGGILVLVWSFTELGTPLMFNYNRVLPVQIFNGLTELESNPLPYGLVLVMLALSALLYAGARAVAGGSAAAVSRGGGVYTARELTGAGQIFPLALFGGVASCAALPHAALLFTAFFRDWQGTVLPRGFTLTHFGNALSHELVLPGIVNSLQYSLLALLLALCAGTLCALVVVRWKLRGGWLFDFLAMLPLAVPGIVMAFGFLGMAIKYRWAGALFDPLGDPLWLLAAAYAVRRLPYVVRSVAAGLEQTPVELEEAARNLGAGAGLTLRKITAPLIAANLLVGGVLAFGFSMLEVSDSLILAQKTEFYPITKAIFELSQVLGSGPFTACAFGVWTMLFMAAVFAAAQGLAGKKFGSLFRF